jgi:hypothetical protein
MKYEMCKFSPVNWSSLFLLHILWNNDSSMIRILSNVEGKNDEYIKLKNTRWDFNIENFLIEIFLVSERNFILEYLIDIRISSKTQIQSSLDFFFFKSQLN